MSRLRTCNLSSGNPEIIPIVGLTVRRNRTDARFFSDFDSSDGILPDHKGGYLSGAGRESVRGIEGDGDIEGRAGMAGGIDPAFDGGGGGLG